MHVTFTYPAFETLLARIQNDKLQLWSAIQADFLAAVSRFDSDWAAANGAMTLGEYKVKAHYLEMFFSRLLQHRTGQPITGDDLAGLGFETHQIDLVFPAQSKDGRPYACAEVKCAGVPKHKGNAKAGVAGRATTMDLDKRLREIVATSIDLKHRWRRDQPRTGPPPSGDPLYAVFYVARAASQADAATIVRKVEVFFAAGYVDAVGLFVYAASDAAHQTNYVPVANGVFPMDAALDAFSRRVAAV